MRYIIALPFTLAALTAGSLCHAASDDHFSRTVAAQPQGVVDISNVAGLVEVTGWDRSEVSVEAELDEGVERVDVTSEGNRTGIKVVLPNGGSRHAEAKLHIKVPKNSEVDVSAVSADVKSSGVLGVQRLTAVSGDMTTEIAGSDAELKTVSGDMKVRGHGQPARLRITSVSGDVHLEHGGGDLETSTVSGTLVVSLDNVQRVSARSTSGDMRIESKLARGANFEATTVSGDLTVKAPSDGGFGYEVSTFSGDIEDCFGEKATRTSQYGPGKTLQGTRAEGASHLRLKTMSGDVQLCDH